MKNRYLAVPAQPETVEELSALYPANPFATVGYFRSRRLTGWTTWLLLRHDDAGRLESGCGAFVKTRGLGRKLEIPSLPVVTAESSFWTSLWELCDRQGVAKVQLDTFGSPPGVEIPPVGTCTHRARCEFVLDLTGDFDSAIDRRHRQHIRKAERAGLVFRRSASDAAIDAHRRMIDSSMDRRRSRGEDVPRAGPTEEFRALLQSRAGELYQALEGETVVASGLVLRAPEGVYFHSRGTSPRGMVCGASHFLVHRMMRQFSTETLRTFNLGGADEGSGLERFKQKFGATRVDLPSSICYVGPAWRRGAYRAAETARSDPKALMRKVAHRVSLLAVFAADVDDIPRQELDAGATGVEFRPLTKSDLCTLLTDYPDFRELQLDRAFRFGTSYAYGAFVDENVANISWLLPPAGMLRDEPRWRRPAPDEAEITAVETLPEYRGRGIHSMMNVYLVEVARAQGVRRIWGKVELGNEASAAGARKGGMRQVGWVMLVHPPFSGHAIPVRFYR